MSHQYQIFSPYCVCPIGAHVDHQHGLVTGFALDKGIDLFFSPADNDEVVLTSANFSGEVRLNVVCPMYEHHHDWGDYLRGAVWAMQQSHQLKRGLTGTVSGQIPSGGVASSAALLCGFIMALAKVNDISLTRQDIIRFSCMAERTYVGLNSGVLDPSCISLCHQDQLLFLDTDTQEHRLIRFGGDNGTHVPFKIAIFYSGVTRSLTHTDYNLRVQECQAAAWILQAYENRQISKLEESYLRSVDRATYSKHANQMPIRFSRRARHFFTELERAKDGAQAWAEGDMWHFGELMFESCESSILNYECGSQELIAIFRTLRQTDGVYGARFCGAGFIGSCFALIDPDREDEIREAVTENYLSEFPDYKDTFRTFICQTNKGVDFV